MYICKAQTELNKYQLCQATAMMIDKQLTVSLMTATVPHHSSISTTFNVACEKIPRQTAVA